ncbi:inactive protein tyrosine kinase pTKL isoform X4 [Hydra vulgaris]|uniref:Inactive protein tyrosine kinase pTKL isoform X4 n=1 Tax=Hydra vulgaris TaxID=6087 RepID=A0ABM4B817_HYDVU
MISMPKINAYNLLDFAVSKEKRVYDCLLEVAIEQRNASLALMQWIQVDSNTSLKNAISSLDEIYRMWLDVQIEFVNESKLFQHGLNDILKVEAELATIQNHIKDNTEKKKFIINSQSIKKLDKSNEIYLNRLEEDIIEAKSVLKSKKYKAEVQKNTVLKNSLLFLMKSHLKLARKSESIFLTAIDIIEKISDFPCESKDLENIFEPQQTAKKSDSTLTKSSTRNESDDYIKANKPRTISAPDFNTCVSTIKNAKKSDSILPKSLPRNESDGYIMANKPRTISAPEFKTFAPTIGNDNFGEEIREELSKYFQSSDYYVPIHDNNDENRSNNYSCSESINSNSYDSSNYELESKNVTVLSKTCSIEKSKDLIQVIFPFDKEFSLKPTSKLSANLSPKLSPNPSPKLSPKSLPKLSHVPSPKQSPNSSPKLSPNPSQKLLRKTSPGVSPRFTPDVSSKHS